MAGTAGTHKNMRFQRGQRIVCGAPTNWALDIEIWEQGYFNVGNRPRSFPGRESDGQRLVFALQRREVLVVFGTEREIRVHFVVLGLMIDLFTNLL
jgi:hypothetical protein